MTTETPTTGDWWRAGVAYQVYVRSFADANGDGIGDLDGVRSRLDDLVEVGVDVIWLSPVFPSPMLDYGYDIVDYCDIDPTFGDLSAVDQLLDAAHHRGIRVLLDWVPNHTSTDHPWFLESASSTDNPKRDWYVWVDQPGDQPPNNWQSCFPAVGSAWSRHPTTGHWYLHSFLREQADLNWDNPEVVAAAQDVMRFWLDRGIDGFRIDVVHNLGKDPDLTDNPSKIVRPSRETAGRRFDEDHWPNLWPKIESIRGVLDEYPGTIAVGESYVLDAERLAAYTAPKRLHLAHDFTLTELDWNATAFAEAINRSNDALGPTGWPAWILSSHDHGRLSSRWAHDGTMATPGCGVFDPARAEAALALLILMRGTPFIFQGEELALPDASTEFDVDGRSRSRAPLPWDQSAPASGFSTGIPWMPIPDAAALRTRSTQLADENSTLRHVRALTRLRRNSPALHSGSQHVRADNGVLTIERRAANETVTITVNMTTSPMRHPTPAGEELYMRQARHLDNVIHLDASGISIASTSCATTPSTLTTRICPKKT